jgi:hypothetical protein
MKIRWIGPRLPYRGTGIWSAAISDRELASAIHYGKSVPNAPGIHPAGMRHHNADLRGQLF